MGIIVKFILRNIWEKKFRTLLILFSIMISTALFFTSNSITNSVSRMFIDRLRSFYGSADVLIQPNNGSPSPFITVDGVQKYSSETDYVVGIVQGSGDYVYNNNQTLNFTMLGVNLDEYSKMNSILLSRESGLYPFEGKKAIIGEKTALKYDLQLGDSMELEINGVKTSFVIDGIARQSGLFINDGLSDFIVTPRDELSSLYGGGDNVNLICVRLKNSADTGQFISKVSKQYSNYTVKETYTKEELSSLTGGMTTALLIMSIMISSISIFIIYTSFRVLTIERLPVIGTFRSVGATKKMTNIIMLAESIIYGILGGAAGCLAGIGVLFILTSITGGDMTNSAVPGVLGGGSAAISLTGNQLGLSFAFAVILALISCIIPIFKISKLPLKDIVLNTIEIKNIKRKSRLILGLIFVLMAFAGPPLFPKGIAMPLDILCLIFTISACILLIPFLTESLSFLFEVVYGFILGNEGILAAKNLRGNRSIINNISLLAVGISAIIMMGTAGRSETAMLTKLYKSADFQVWITGMPGADKNLVDTLSHMDGVKDAYPIFRISNTGIANTQGQSVSIIDGVDKDKLPEYWRFDYYGNQEQLLSELDQGRNIILTNTLEKVLKVNTGDSITLKLPGGDKIYKIIGFVNTSMGDGSYGLISQDNLISDTGIKYYTNIFIKTSGNPDSVKQEVLNKFSDLKPSLNTVAQMEQDDREALGNTFTILNGLSFVTLIIGIFGMLNNLVISFMERKRSFAMFRCVGMNKRQIVKMILIEAFTAGMTGGIVGILSGLLLIWNMPYTMKSIDMLISVQYPTWSLTAYLILGVVIFIAASTGTAAKSSRLNIIEALKYE